MRQLAQEYRYSSLGLLWAFAPSIVTAIILIANQRSQLVTQGVAVPAAFYGIFGLAMGQTLLEAINTTRRLFLANQEVMRRQGIPLEGMMMAYLYDIAFNLMVRLAVLVVMFLLFSVRLSLATVALAALGFAGIALMGAGLGLLMAPLCCLKKDVDRVFSILPWVVFAVTPTFVPLPKSGLGELIEQYNPLVWVFDGVRAAAYAANGEITSTIWGLFAGLAILFVGAMFCRVAQPHVVERMLG